jgi:TolB-like protein
MIKRLCAAFALSLSIAAAAGAQDRIAVLDTELPKGMDTKVIIPVTEKIMEEFVRSKLFIVLDRSFIAKTLSELEFSTSDLTAGDSDKLATIGGFLKASYIVVSTVQKLDNTFFLSAKMIEVKTGVITAQTSVNRDGSTSVLIDMAGELGRKLVAAAMGQETASGGRVVTQSTTQPATTKPADAKPPKEPKPKSTRFSTVTVDFGSGATIGMLLGNSYDVDLYTGSDISFDPVAGTAYGVSGMFTSGLFYLSAGFMMNSTEYYAGYTTYTSSYDMGLGLGIDIPIGPVQTYAGVRGSYLVLDWEEDGTYYYSGTWSGIGYGFEVGADIRLGIFALGVRYAFDMGTLTDDSGDWVDLELATGALAFRAGIAY